MPTITELGNPTFLVPVACFLTVLLGGWALLTLLVSRTEEAEYRLSRLIQHTVEQRAARRVQKEDQRLQDKVAEVAARLAGAAQPKNEAELSKIRVLLLNAGFRNQNAVKIFLGFKVSLLLVALVVSIPPAISHFGATIQGLFAILLATAVGYYLPGIIVSSRKTKRQQAIFLGLPDALDLMVVCVEAGLGFDAAVRRVTTELRDSCPILCDEFEIVNFQIQMGRPRREALRDLGIRTGVDDVRSLAAVIIQAEKFGSSIGQALRVQSDAMRLRRRQLAEEKAAKTAVKIMIPLVLFIFPGVFIVLVGPAAISIMNTILK